MITIGSRVYDASNEACVGEVIGIDEGYYFTVKSILDDKIYKVSQMNIYEVGTGPAMKEYDEYLASLEADEEEMEAIYQDLMDSDDFFGSLYDDLYDEESYEHDFLVELENEFQEKQIAYEYEYVKTHGE